MQQVTHGMKLSHAARAALRQIRIYGSRRQIFTLTVSHPLRLAHNTTAPTKSLHVATFIRATLASGFANMAPRELNFITGNKNKLTEVQTILGSVVHLQSQSLDLVEIQGTIEEVSTDKCRRAAELVYF